MARTGKNINKFKFTSYPPKPLNSIIFRDDATWNPQGLSPCWPAASVSASSVQEGGCGALVSEGPTGDNPQGSLVMLGCWRLNAESSWSSNSPSLGLLAASWSNSWLTWWSAMGWSMWALVSVGNRLVQKLVSDDGCTSDSGGMVAVSTLPLPSGVHLPDGWALLGCPVLLEIRM